ncbi:hypothetical protein KIPB_001028 [Kipferlia bialata]|uniref:Uncharacterized protein n=1 Tax=Kipferlia bialata TaxID=797122 RepID=A0A9K3CQ24_9EUKA|nr:hypothetical protein KIPB_001028 [Kipferlia bialata]|eukprot:g1028.t1
MTFGTLGNRECVASVLRSLSLSHSRYMFRAHVDKGTEGALGLDDESSSDSEPEDELEREALLFCWSRVLKAYRDLSTLSGLSADTGLQADLQTYVLSQLSTGLCDRPGDVLSACVYGGPSDRSYPPLTMRHFLTLLRDLVSSTQQSHRPYESDIHSVIHHIVAETVRGLTEAFTQPILPPTAPEALAGCVDLLSYCVVHGLSFVIAVDAKSAEGERESKRGKRGKGRRGAQAERETAIVPLVCDLMLQVNSYATSKTDATELPVGDLICCGQALDIAAHVSCLTMLPVLSTANTPNGERRVVCEANPKHASPLQSPCSSLLSSLLSPSSLPYTPLFLRGVGGGCIQRLCVNLNVRPHATVQLVLDAVLGSLNSGNAWHAETPPAEVHDVYAALGEGGAQGALCMASLLDVIRLWVEAPTDADVTVDAFFTGGSTQGGIETQGGVFPYMRGTTELEPFSDRHVIYMSTLIDRILPLLVSVLGGVVNETALNPVKRSASLLILCADRHLVHQTKEGSYTQTGMHVLSPQLESLLFPPPPPHPALKQGETVSMTKSLKVMSWIVLVSCRPGRDGQGLGDGRGISIDRDRCLPFLIDLHPQTEARLIWVAALNTIQYMACWPECRSMLLPLPPSFSGLCAHVSRVCNGSREGALAQQVLSSLQGTSPSHSPVSKHLEALVADDFALV